MFYVYILKDKNGKLYIGYSADLKRRMSEHLSNKFYSTKRMNCPKLIYYEAYNSKELARRREKNLKKFSSAYYSLIKRIHLK